MSTRVDLAWAFAAPMATGVLVVCAAPGVLPWSAPSWLAWVAFAPLLCVVLRRGVKHAAAAGFTTGLVVHLGVCLWFPGLIARFGGLHPALAIGLYVLLACWQGAGWAAWAATVHLLSRRWPLVLAAPVSFMGFELVMPMVFDYSVGLTQVHHTLVAQVAELGGPIVISGLLVASGAVVATVVRARTARLATPWRSAVAVGALVALVLVFGAARLASIDAEREAAPILRVGVVQQGVALPGWSPPAADEDIVRRYQRGSERLEAEHGTVDLLVWPEKAYGLIRRDAKHDYTASHPRRVRTGFASPLLFGSTSVDPVTREVGNAAAFLSADGELRVVYEKVRLILYSEWLPSWLQSVVKGGKRYRAGSRFDPVEVRARATDESVRVGVFICFEATFPQQVAAVVAHRAEVLVNLSDDTWFGDSAEPEQHLAHAVFRAIESRRDVVRATGGGISALITATGEVSQHTALQRERSGSNVTMVADARVLRGMSLYAHVGASLPVASALATLLGLAIFARRRRNHGLGSGGRSASQAPPSS